MLTFRQHQRTIKKSSTIQIGTADRNANDSGESGSATKGLPLPFVSAGGTSMLLSSAAVGVLLNIARGQTTED